MQNVFNEMFLYNEDKMLGAERVFKYRKIKLNGKFYYDPLCKTGINVLNNILYGSFSGGIKPHEKMDKPFARYKTGIEILGMKPRRTKDGKYKYQNISTQDLKDKCKINGIKGYSKCDKTELVKLLMKVDS
jgi:hypothetical protein